MAGRTPPPRKAVSNHPRPDRSPIPAVDIALPRTTKRASSRRASSGCTSTSASTSLTRGRSRSPRTAATDPDSPARTSASRASCREVGFVSRCRTPRSPAAPCGDGSGRRAALRSSHTWTSTSRPISPPNTLVAPVVSDDADIVIGSRMSPSRSFAALPSVRCSAAATWRCRGRSPLLVPRRAMWLQGVACDVAAELLPLIEDDGWFFDTELLLLATQT